ncbi:MAG TPA: ABC transporter permease [Streptosporangiaceae bacterium]|nr:ABC transporter permease [Streptosporangiaceae bacterium]
MAQVTTSLTELDISRPAEGGEVGPLQSGWRLALREFAQNKLAVIGLTILAFFVLFCFAGPLVYHGAVLSTNLGSSDLSPGTGHPFGTDDVGFDELALLMWGGRAALEVGFFAAIIGIGIGALWGAVSGLVGGFADAFMMRVVDVFLSIPFLFIVLVVAVKYGASVLGLSLIIGGFTWLVPARLVRGEVLSLRTRDFVAAARAAGSTPWRLIRKHLLPNALGVMIVNVTFNVADAILAVAALGYLGYGLHYPTQDWGDMLSSGIQDLQNGYWWLVYPVGACIVLVVMAANLVGDALRDALDVRLRRR